MGRIGNNPSTPPTTRVGAAELLKIDPPKPAGTDGWSPDNIKEVVSKDPKGFVSSAVKFAMNGVHEQPGQRLSLEQINELAPMYADTFHLDEEYVKKVLSEVYLYIGGPSMGGMAITIGTHVFMPDADDLHRILSPDGKRWLAHELTHTLQFASYSHGSIHSSITSYMRSLFLGIDPNRPGSGSGPIVWGAAFTGLRLLHKPNEDVGASALSPIHRLEFSALPAALVGTSLGLAVGGGVAASRLAIARHAPAEIQKLNVLGARGGIKTGMSTIALPMLIGAASGMFADTLGKREAKALGAVGGAAAATGLLYRYGAFKGGANPTMSKLIAGGAIALAGAAGYLSATASANTIQGWSRNGELLRGHYSATHKPDTFSDKLHDAHWAEIDAESVARNYINKTDHTWDTSKYEGKLPSPPNRGRDRLDWGLWNPLIVGAPLALGAGGGILAARVGKTVLTDTLVKGKGFGAIPAAIELLGNKKRGVVGSLATGAAATMAPLLIGGTVAGVTDSFGMDGTTSRIVGTSAAALGTGALLTMLVGKPGGSIIQRSPYVLAGALMGGILGYVASNAAVNASHPHERTYDIPADIRKSSSPR